MFLFWLAVAVFLIYLLRKWFDSVFDDTVGDPVEVTSNSNSTRLNNGKDYSPVDPNVVRLADITVKLMLAEHRSDRFSLYCYRDGIVFLTLKNSFDFYMSDSNDVFLESYYHFDDNDISFMKANGEMDRSDFVIRFIASCPMKTFEYIKNYFESKKLRDILSKNNKTISSSINDKASYYCIVDEGKIEITDYYR